MFKKFFSFLNEEEDDYVEEDKGGFISSFWEDSIFPRIIDMIEDVIADVFDNIKDGILDTVHNMFTDDEYVPRSRSRRTGYSKVSTRRHKSKTKSFRKSKRPDPISVTFDTQSEAIEVKEALIDIYDENDVVTVADFYDVVNDECDEDYKVEATDEDYGWETNPKSWVVKRRNGEYIIASPKIRRLD